ncbi:MAG: LPS export ABC transporter permease LptF [Gammaproteobacteria bacterium]|nr:LPS export ABC transporter permease LptF [Gammaproteobacteria bacterium]
MLVLNRYLAKEVLFALLAVVTVLMLIFTSGELIGLYGEVAGGSLQVKSVLTLLGYHSITNLVFVLPLSFYIAVLLAFYRLYKDNEMIVLAACGIGQLNVLRALWRPALVFAALVGVLAFMIAPWAEAEGEILIKQAKERSDLDGVNAGRFNELTRGEGVVYTQEFNQAQGTMGNVFLQHEWKDKSSIITSASGKREINPETGDRFFILYNGYRYDTEYKTGRSAIVKFGEHGIRLPDEPELQRPQLRQRAMSTIDIWRRGQIGDIAEIQWRFSAVLTCLGLAVLALPLSRTSARQGRYSKLAMALLIYIIYTNMVSVSLAWLRKGQISMWLGLWWVHVAAILLAVLLYIEWKPIRYYVIKLLTRLKY